MPRMALNDRRDELVEAAIRVMARDGVVKATTRAIVAEAGMTLGVFHYCFDSREELLKRVTATITERTIADARRVFTREGDLPDMIRASLRAFWGGVEANPGENLVGYELTQYALRNPGLEDVARLQYVQYLEANAEFLELMAKDAGIEWTIPLPTLARYVNAVLDGVTISWLADRESEDSLAVLDLLGDYLTEHSRPVG
ncbi:MAG: putative TetR-family regulator [Amycolatopsis sp.]|jgi:AcrR family transcriptional regulator|uniref:TetR/AcrR family transcriptional regulator n=1 Tax=Amycolatopsis sp. TaxID=37632 RepID=UPI002610BC7E|nr:TetR family transcriptional regulator [Amycolatopsis sp.]MCU1681870.1 putative TetR-family regulator [Amycolatopsis sp.]